MADMNISSRISIYETNMKRTLEEELADMKPKPKRLENPDHNTEDFIGSGGLGRAEDSEYI